MSAKEFKKRGFNFFKNSCLKKTLSYFERKSKPISFTSNHLLYEVFKKTPLFDVREDDFLFVIILIDNIITGKAL